MIEPIQVWRFPEAPEELRALSPHGGDEDWLALIPPPLTDLWMALLETQVFGYCHISEHVHPMLPGWKVQIGVHA